MQDIRSDNELLQIIWDYMSIETPLQQADVIVVGGCTNTDLAHYAAALYHKALAPLIVFSGYAQPTMSQTEADLLADTAVTAGVPESAILREQHASNTGENITRSAELLQQRGVSPRTVILIHKPYMSRRFLATAEAQWPDPQPHFITQHEETTLSQYAEKHGWEDTKCKTLGDFSRMEKYAKHGHQSIQAIPSRVQQAFDIMMWRGHKMR